ncbi:hypothetical protein EGW08_006744 [Elysia chlorotica]|uniref:Uncharacterized protein n=1 Tax=Elysia chlorotica TaxID=188477 RepID=A0A3S1BJX2_ELYCH|nr:hypothetical protein EGW08_006744 [Elysia chlorotica]
MKALLLSLGLAAMLGACQASVCSDICHNSCDTGEDIYNRWMDMTPEQIAESAHECNEVCDPVCDCLDNCVIKCLAELRDCRYQAGSISGLVTCQTQFTQCGGPCDDQCASAVTLAGIKVTNARDRVMSSLKQFVYGMIEQFKQYHPSDAQKQESATGAGSAEEKTSDAGENRSGLTREAVTANDSE